jgi:hypothetical protein
MTTISAYPLCWPPNVPRAPRLRLHVWNIVARALAAMEYR